MKANEAPKSKFVYPDKLYARTKDDITLDISYAPQTLEAVEYIRKDAFIEKAVEGRVIDDGGEIHLVVPELPTITRNMDDGEKVKVLIFK